MNNGEIAEPAADPDSGTEAGEPCRCEGGQPKNFARPCLLLLLSEAPAHGYELIDRMRPFGFEVGDPASVYKTLRQMERDRIVSSKWELPSRGPARRVYALTSDGRDLLDAWAHTLERNRVVLDTFLARFRNTSADEVASRDTASQRRVRETVGGRT